MKTLGYYIYVSRLLTFSFWVLALSCTDHEVNNLPDSECKAVDGSARLFPCEFVIEKITFLAKDGSDLGVFTGSAQSAMLSRFKAKENTYAGNEPDKVGVATFTIRVTLKRVATPSFPVNTGYLLSYTHNDAGKRIIHSPGERVFESSPVMLDMPVGESKDLLFDMVFPYKMENVAGSIRPIAIKPLTSIFIDNDVTTVKFDRNKYPYTAVGSVVEAYYEKLMIIISD